MSSGNNAEADVLDVLDQTNRLLRQYTDPSSGAFLNSYDMALMLNMSSINLHMQNLFKQHNEMTQFLTYANQLWQLESYISKKLQSDSIAVKKGSNTMTTTIYDVRQRYMDKTSTVFYRVWLTTVMKRSILTTLLFATVIALAADNLITPTVSYVLMAVLIVYYFIWFYGQIDKNSRRDPQDPNVYLDWNYFPTGDKVNDGSKKCSS